MINNTIVIGGAIFSLLLTTICILVLLIKYKKLNEKYDQDTIKEWRFIKIIFQSNTNKIYTSGNLYSVKAMDNEYILADIIDIERTIFNEHILKNKINTVNETYKPKVVFVNRASPNTWSWKIHSNKYSNKYSHIFRYYMVMSELDHIDVDTCNRIFPLVEEFDAKHNHKLYYIDTTTK